MQRSEVEELLINLILDGKIAGKIDQVNDRLELDRQYALQTFPSTAPNSNYSSIQLGIRETSLRSNVQLG